MLDSSAHVFLAFLQPAGDTGAGAHLALELLIIFGTAKLLGSMCERLRQPGIVGEIFAGILIGPSLLNWVRPNDVTEALAEMGVLFLLFRVGLEVKASDILRVGRSAVLVAVLGVALPFVAGWAFMRSVGVSTIEALFVAAALVATSVGITAQVLEAKGLLDERASKVILAAAVIDDILGLLVLGIITGLRNGNLNIPALMVTGVTAAALTVVVALYGSRAMKHIVTRIERRLTFQERQFEFALIVLFALSASAAFVGMAAIIGAFLAGMALSESVDHRVSDLAHGISELLVPFFLASIGLHLNLAAFLQPRILGVTAAICLIAVGSKFIGCGLGAWNLGRRDMVRIGVGMIPRGEVGMVVAQLGLSLGVVEHDIYASVVAMAIVTTLVAPPLLNYTFRTCRPALPSQDLSEREAGSAAIPCGQMQYNREK